MVFIFFGFCFTISSVQKKKKKKTQFLIFQQNNLHMAVQLSLHLSNNSTNFLQVSWYYHLLSWLQGLSFQGKTKNISPLFDKIDLQALIRLVGENRKKNLIFAIPIIPQTLNINNQKTTSARKLIELSSIALNAMSCFTVFKIQLFEYRLMFSPSQLGTGSKRVQVSVKKTQKCELFDEIT